MLFLEFGRILDAYGTQIGRMDAYWPQGRILDAGPPIGRLLAAYWPPIGRLWDAFLVYNQDFCIC